MDIYKKLKVKYYKSILVTLKKQNHDYSWVENHINILLTKDNNTSEASTKDNTETDENKENTNDQDHYKKPWNKLNIIHKILKMKEFINNLKTITNDNKESLKNQLCQLLKDKILTKKDKINYDMVNGKIISLIDLQYKDNKYVYLCE